MDESPCGVGVVDEPTPRRRDGRRACDDAGAPRFPRSRSSRSACSSFVVELAVLGSLGSAPDVGRDRSAGGPARRFGTTWLAIAAGQHGYAAPISDAPRVARSWCIHGCTTVVPTVVHPRLPQERCHRGASTVAPRSSPRGASSVAPGTLPPWCIHGCPRNAATLVHPRLPQETGSHWCNLDCVRMARVVTQPGLRQEWALPRASDTRGHPLGITHTPAQAAPHLAPEHARARATPVACPPTGILYPCCAPSHRCGR